jgi:hypothetical protein
MAGWFLVSLACQMSELARETMTWALRLFADRITAVNEQNSISALRRSTPPESGEKPKSVSDISAAPIALEMVFPVRGQFSLYLMNFRAMLVA